MILLWWTMTDGQVYTMRRWDWLSHTLWFILALIGKYKWDIDMPSIYVFCHSTFPMYYGWMNDINIRHMIMSRKRIAGGKGVSLSFFKQEWTSGWRINSAKLQIRGLIRGMMMMNSSVGGLEDSQKRHLIQEMVSIKKGMLSQLSKRWLQPLPMWVHYSHRLVMARNFSYLGQYSLCTSLGPPCQGFYVEE